MVVERDGVRGVVATVESELNRDDYSVDDGGRRAKNCSVRVGKGCCIDRDIAKPAGCGCCRHEIGAKERDKCGTRGGPTVRFNCSD